MLHIAVPKTFFKQIYLVFNVRIFMMIVKELCFLHAGIARQKTSAYHSEWFHWCVKWEGQRWKWRSWSSQTLNHHCWHRKLRWVVVVFGFALDGFWRPIENQDIPYDLVTDMKLSFAIIVAAVLVNTVLWNKTAHLPVGGLT